MILGVLIDAAATATEAAKPTGLAAVNEYASSINLAFLVTLTIAMVKGYYTYSKDKKDADEKLEQKIDGKLAKATLDHDKRLEKLEEKAQGFMHKSDILEKIAHERDNRLQNQLLFKGETDKHGVRINDVERTLSRYDERFEHLKDDIGDIDKKIGRIDDKLDRLQECLNLLNKKV